MAKKNPKLVLADKREWATSHFLGDGDPKEYPQAAQKVRMNSFEILTMHNTVEFQIGENLSPAKVQGLIDAGWAIDVKKYERKEPY